MKHRTTITFATFALLGVAGIAGAQTESRPRTEGVVAAAPKAAPVKRPAGVRVGILRPSPPAQPIVVNTTGLPMVTNARVSPSQPQRPATVAGGVSRVSYYPTLVLSDGRVIADFGTGRGYEQVLRQCANIVGTLPPGTVVAPCWTVDAYGVYRVVQQR